jgi:hypothetical protein
MEFSKNRVRFPDARRDVVRKSPAKWDSYQEYFLFPSRNYAGIAGRNP